ncbi:MAG: exostosin family protein [Methanolobus sp.]|uniref:exostosin domain-containing protein n=1 Tax=Methanolobus sp. TaxID=1874737 RepID=UPI00272F6E32|nr:exostosin family protein [Methanolobus sp.]MDP2217467.1 exostosin family protein [Methanolobus sp.]
MKIYILPIHPNLQPKSQSFNYPKHNKDFGTEQDFYEYITKQKDIIVKMPDEADWHYLPVFWTRWHLNHDYGKWGLIELQNEIDKTIIDDRRTFTICQYDDGPVVDVGKTVQFLGSRKTESYRDSPLLSSPHKKPFLKPSKKYLASFTGRLSTHPIRQEISEQLKNRDDIYINDGDKGSKFFVKKMLQSHIALCPRGYGGSSFRFFEAMQLGMVPFLIGDIDTRPFKEFINWDEVSFFSNNASHLAEILSSLDKSELLLMGEKAEMIWKEKLTYQKWCHYVIKELEGF